MPEGVSATLLETYEGQGGYVGSAVLSFALEPGASLERVVLLDEPAGAVSISASTVTLGAGARFAQTVVAAGARLQRMRRTWSIRARARRCAWTGFTCSADRATPT